MKYLLLLLLPFILNAQIMSNDANTEGLWYFENNGDEVANRDAGLSATGTIAYFATGKCTYAAEGKNGQLFTETAFGNLSSGGTLEAILKKNSTAAAYCDVFIHYAVSNRLYLRIIANTGQVVVSIGNLSLAQPAGVTITDDSYHYVAMTWHCTDGVDTTYSLWIDNVKKVDATAFTGGVNLSASSNLIGYTSSVSLYVDEMKLSNKERSDAEIAAVYARFLSYSNCPEEDTGNTFKNFDHYNDFRK